jgi:hypothetical protein
MDLREDGATAPAAAMLHEFTGLKGPACLQLFYTHETLMKSPFRVMTPPWTGAIKSRGWGLK